ncbi:polyphosphate:nucleotide phosphotransferase, PPK2 family [Bradyrhizobium lablabi]|uniref:Polyphosphate:nucleotide phosphotransferase, PPK2 family n=1 Tax=Bradyrhizobium lablabi TaxID=722472 RepID=A0A1M6NS79_9BRAD|nr:polyphosphate kinase 2 family protein [Bradyrhizobium lablabi]SHJ98553.1 polyphosphate:nucleotide phosphotransferase, PPK2 family [Bradyrhizobium lablabi]
MSKTPARSPAAKPEAFVTPFRFDGSGKFHLKAYKTDERGGLDKDKAEEILEANRKRLKDFQEKLYAQNRWSVLLIFQGMDAAGKDSTIKHIFEGVNPQGCEVHSFKQPTSQELDHDFMWRHVIALPARGHIGIFNRSHYEECLVTRLHPELLKQERIPPKLITKNIWRERFEDISAIERYLSRNGNVILKFFLNISKEEQRKRFLDRLDDPAKNWKFSMADITERALWNRYMAVYQDIVRHTSSAVAPWHVVPADHKWFARVVIGSAIVSALDSLNLRFPRADKASLEEFKRVRKALEQEGEGRRKKVAKAGKRVAAKGG